jgi:mannose-1-phosphate guanylyltransferase
MSINPQERGLPAVVLVGGQGTRLRPLTEQTPKPMLPILGRPLLAYTFDQLKAGGVERAILSCGYLPDEIEEYFGDNFDGLELEYRVEPEPRGTGGGIRFAADGIAQTFVALNGDSLREAELAPLLEFHRERQAEATILLARADDPSRYGLVRTDGEDRVIGFLEKPAPDEIDTNLINAGLYVLEPEVLELIDQDKPVSIEREIFPTLAKRRTLFGLFLPGYWLDVGTPESYLLAHHDLLSRRASIDVDPGADVSPGAELLAPVAIAHDATVEAGAQIGPSVYLARGARVEAGAHVEHAVVLPGGVVPRCAVVAHAIISSHVLVGSM